MRQSDSMEHGGDWLESRTACLIRIFGRLPRIATAAVILALAEKFQPAWLTVLNCLPQFFFEVRQFGFAENGRAHVVTGTSGVFAAEHFGRFTLLSIHTLIIAKAVWSQVIS